jgi:hypothetical protein
MKALALDKVLDPLAGLDREWRPCEIAAAFVASPERHYGAL